MSFYWNPNVGLWKLFLLLYYYNLITKKKINIILLCFTNWNQFKHIILNIHPLTSPNFPNSSCINLLKKNSYKNGHLSLKPKKQHKLKNKKYPSYSPTSFLMTATGIGLFNTTIVGTDYTDFTINANADAKYCWRCC